MNITTDTYREIVQQPRVWRRVYELLKSRKADLQVFLRPFVEGKTEIVLTGAGSSAFIGDSLVPILRNECGWNCRAVATTDLVTHAASYVDCEEPLLLVSFARSGDSPESIAAVNEVNRVCKKASHMVITCNRNGALAKRQWESDAYVILLPEETNDKSLVMTSSFSSMFLACLMAGHINEIEDEKSYVDAAAANAQYILDHCEQTLREAAEHPMDRAIFLGGGSAQGIAEECHLKLQEMTDGAIMCAFNSFLGFRHGPKAVLSTHCGVIYFMNSIPVARQYAKDLIRQIADGGLPIVQLAVMQEDEDLPASVTKIILPEGYQQTHGYGAISYVLVGQLMGLYACLKHGLNPDNPSKSGNISRVVQGVTIY